MLGRYGKKADMGIGTLILFIAMILVAAIAAGVLIQTATSLQSKALETGKRSTVEVSTAIRTLLLYGEDASATRSISHLRQQIKLVAGADSIKFNDSVITVDTKNLSEDLSYEVANNYDLTTCEAATGNKYRTYYVKNGSGHTDGYIVVGDVVTLCYDLPRLVSEDELIRTNFIPKVGSVHSVVMTTPGTMITKRVFLYP
jgi:flagellin-like protein